ncbi:glycosyltransferase family 39 protein [Geomonas sp. RF6]|uniref:glycosyltransferase family 39 protein n=1 Tax=Geomonas sp. RF6 TaxID=2897342 RepID=UPI001E32144D|nr:glycosyltransferase family 39 protein [Geomonas sp. RF6]UFS70762.1 glycosyltransferase family 39 protein [Geomonas sp. RF6]
MKRAIAYLQEKTTGVITDLTTLAVIFGIAFFQFLGRLPLTGTDEARYLEIPREMIERGDFVTPTLNYVKYFEKPPLHYWLNAFSTLLFGETPFAARFSGALFGVLGVLLTYHIGRKLFGRRAGFLSAVILGTSLGVVIQSRVNITDTPLTFCLCAALGSFLLASRPDEKHKGVYYHLFYVFAALAVLAKGLIGLVLPGFIICAYIMLNWRWSILKEMRLLTGIPLFFAVCAPWFVLVSLRNPEFPYFFFIHEHFERYLTKVHGRYQPPWFFLPVLFGCMLPWAFFLPNALVRAWKKWRQEKDDGVLFLSLWALLILGFFSLSDSKLIPYILPVYPAFSILIGCLIADFIDKPAEALRKPAVALAAVHIIIGAGVIAYPYLAKTPKIAAAGGILIGTIFLVQGIVALRNSYRATTPALFAGLAAVGFLCSICAPPVVYQGIADRKVTKDLALMVKERAGSDALVASFGYEQELPLYTGRRVIVVGSKGELEFGAKQGDNSFWFIESEQFRSLWAGPRPVYALISPEDLQNMAALTPPPVILGMRAKRALITNREQPEKGPVVKMSTAGAANGSMASASR